MAATDPDQALWDDIVEAIELRNLDPANCWVIGGPRLRRRLKKVSMPLGIRERTNVGPGPGENARYISWNDLNVCDYAT